MGLSNEWGVRVKPGEHGLRLRDLNVGIYGEVPEEWNDHTRRPRGALPRPGIPPLPYNLRSKHDCLVNFRNRVTADGSASESELDSIDADVLTLIDSAVMEARSAPRPRPEDVDKDVYINYAQGGA